MENISDKNDDNWMRKCFCYNFYLIAFFISDTTDLGSNADRPFDDESNDEGATLTLGEQTSVTSEFSNEQMFAL